ncbi:hypothetical protein [Acinetobacter sp. YH12063]|uniref:hypothetical protein n=1 Tax=Acinetobacter sp. YH12063 TaxID=2601061 RepID=UPI0015D38C8D|nr:hypothetical protein [Acinetobacter sp. YH12063]
MITFQYVNDLAVQLATDHKKTGVYRETTISKRVLKNKKLRGFFKLEYNNAYGGVYFKHLD